MPSNKKANRTATDRWIELVEQWRDAMPHLTSWLLREGEFNELRVKFRDDGTYLAIAKGYDASGGPVVAFGVGYDVILSLLGLNATIAGGHWKVDKPWAGSEVPRPKMGK